MKIRRFIYFYFFTKLGLKLLELVFKALNLYLVSLSQILFFLGNNFKEIVRIRKVVLKLGNLVFQRFVTLLLLRHLLLYLGHLNFKFLILVFFLDLQLLWNYISCLLHSKESKLYVSKPEAQKVTCISRVPHAHIFITSVDFDLNDPGNFWMYCKHLFPDKTHSFLK